MHVKHLVLQLTLVWVFDLATQVQGGSFATYPLGIVLESKTRVVVIKLNQEYEIRAAT